MNMYMLILLVLTVSYCVYGSNTTVIVTADCEYLMGDDMMERCATDCHCNLCIGSYYVNGQKTIVHLCHSKGCRCPGEHIECIREPSPWNCTGEQSMPDKIVYIVLMTLTLASFIPALYFAYIILSAILGMCTECFTSSLVGRKIIDYYTSSQDKTREDV